MSLNFVGHFGKGGLTATVPNVINCLIPPKKHGLTVITTIRYAAGTTAHTLTFLRPIGHTTVSAVAAAGQKVVSLTADPGASLVGPSGAASQLAADAVAAGDWMVFALPDGTFYLDTANSSYSAGAVTMSTNLPTGGLAVNADCWMMGVAADKDPWTGEAFYSIGTTASTTINIQDVLAGLVSSHQQYEPLLVQSNNATVAGTIDWVAGGYVPIGRG